MKFQQWVDYGPKKRWLKFGSDQLGLAYLQSDFSVFLFHVNDHLSMHCQ